MISPLILSSARGWPHLHFDNILSVVLQELVAELGFEFYEAFSLHNKLYLGINVVGGRIRERFQYDMLYSKNGLPQAEWSITWQSASITTKSGY
jgi:hypothetical protein